MVIDTRIITEWNGIYTHNASIDMGIVSARGY